MFVFSRSRDVKWKCWGFFFFTGICKCLQLANVKTFVSDLSLCTDVKLPQWRCYQSSSAPIFLFKQNWRGRYLFETYSSVGGNRTLLPVRLYMGFCSSVWWCSLITGNAKHGTKHSWDLACCLLWRMSEFFAPCQETWWSTGLVVSDSGGEQRTGKAGRMPVSSLCVD